MKKGRGSKGLTIKVYLIRAKRDGFIVIGISKVAFIGPLHLDTCHKTSQDDRVLTETIDRSPHEMGHTGCYVKAQDAHHQNCDQTISIVATMLGIS